MGATVPIACVLFLVAFDLWRLAMLASYCKTGVDVACSANILLCTFLTQIYDVETERKQGR